MKPVKDFYLYFAGLTWLTIGSCFLTQRIAAIVSVGNRYVDFITAVICCAIIPNLIIVVLFHKTEEFQYFADLLKKILNRFLSRTSKG